MTTGTTTRGQSKRLKSLLLSTLPAFTLSMLILLAASLPHACADKIPATEFTLTILHTNDLHSHAEPFLERGKNVGGMARIAHLLRKLKKENKNCLTIDAGDIFQGTPLFTRYKGEVEVELLNKLGYDLYTIGNHEFDEGGINLADKLARARFDVICANLDAAQLPALARVMKPSVIKELGDSKVKVGFVGAITPDIESLSMRRDGARLKRDATKAKEAAWLAPIQEEVSKLKDQGIDKIILVTHCGVDYDKVIAENIAEVDAIIGGHSHSRLSEPVLVNRGEAGPCLIVQTGSYGRSLGQLQLTFDKNGSVLPEKSKYRLLAVNDRLPEEPDVKAYIDKMAEPLKILKETVLTRADGNFDNSWRLYRHDSALGDLIADAFLDAGQSQGVQVAMENRGGIRSFIDRGPITLEKIEEILPFDNHLACATVTGKSLLRNLEHSVAGSLGGRFLDVSGIKFAYDIEKAPGSRIVFALVKDKEGNWKRVEDAATYRIGMTDYSFNGGEGYDFSSAADVTYSQEKLNEPLRRFFLKQKSVRPQAPNRICATVGALTGFLTSKTIVLGGGLSFISKIPNQRLSLYRSNELGVTTIRPGIVVPLAAPQVVLENIEKEDFPVRVRSYLNRERPARELQAAGSEYYVVVLSGSNEKNPESRSRRAYSSIPISTYDLERLTGTNLHDTKTGRSLERH